MGYTTEFNGSIKVEPPLNSQEIDYLKQFAETRRMKRQHGPYFVEGSGMSGQGHDSDIIDYNNPPEGQPGLWCQWVPNDDGSEIVWDGSEKFYDAPEWMQYLIDHFIGKYPISKGILPFMQGHTCNGEIKAQGEDSNDRWKLVVKDNDVKVKQAKIVYED